MTHISDIKLIRTDTTLDLSQKAEKGMLLSLSELPFYTVIPASLVYKRTMWYNKTSSRFKDKLRDYLRIRSL
ncbi:Serine/threonine-protein kinase ZRK7 [Linum grandiflorum]